MKTYLTTTAVALALATSPALANSSQTDIDQILSGVQQALNSIQAGDGGMDIDQAATNAGNVISRGTESLDDIRQRVRHVNQLAGNYLSDDGLPHGGGWDDVNQAATNVLNSLSMEGADSLEDVTQRVKNTIQTAYNVIEFDGDSSNLTQAAVNAANIVSAEDVELYNNADQLLKNLDQTATNSALADDHWDTLTDIAQSATNVGNSLTVGDFDDVLQRARYVDQFAQNYIELDNDLSATEMYAAGDLDIPDGSSVGDIIPNTQNAVNALNIATVLSDRGPITSTITQSVYGSTQTANNILWGLDYSDQLGYLDQSATNVANSMSLDTDNDAGMDLDVLSQTVDSLDQNALNSIDYGSSVSDVTQSATNAANVAVVGDINKYSDQFYSDSYQLATNTVADGSSWGSVEDLTQSATNVINSLSGDDLGNGPYNWDIVQYVNMVEVGHEPEELQFASNYVSFGTGSYHGIGDGLVNLEQAATNAANLISVETVYGTIRQFAVGLDQQAYNTAEPGSHYWGGDVVGQVGVTEQSATNAANILTAEVLPSLSGVTDIVQMSVNGQQFAINSLVTNGMVNNFAQSAVNVANSISLPSAP
ncbi:hypothetical protein [Boseongicola sp. H5]|uniref:hypothetical protein n=1 Tax=Boseongicola sp. H5 TaxID=2763261 RepID=UPI001D0AAF12|nr:hypothetical protein [Boseongicola sp. H5]